MSEQRDELAAAFLRTEALANKKIDRRNWTTDQWVDDAERIMGHIDGASSALLNGHITALLRTIRGLREATKTRTITTVEELDALPEGTLISTPCNNPLYRNVFRKAWADGWLNLDPSDRDDGENTDTAAGLLRWDSKDGTATVLWQPTP